MDLAAVLDRNDPGGAEREPLTRGDVAALQQVMAASGLPHVALAGRTTVVFAFPGMGVGDVYPELAGCTREVCAFIEESAVFDKHGVQVVGLSTEPVEPPPGCIAIPFPVGLLPQDEIVSPLAYVDRGDQRFAVRASYLVYPDGTGERIGSVTDVVAHARKCLSVVTDRRLARFRDASLDHLRRSGAARTVMEAQGLLANGADSVAISRVQLRCELVAKMADPAIVAQEAGYIERINSVMTDAGRTPIFPTVVGVCTDEQPGWYLMEAADPVTLDRTAFTDRDRTALSSWGTAMVQRAIRKVATLYDLTFRAETPAVSRYHYYERFLAIVRREDFRDTFTTLKAGRDIAEVLATPALLPDGTSCRSFDEQMAFLAGHVEQLCEPVGAYVHGDLHLPNMLPSADGTDVVLIDPRVVWDGNDVGDPGFCDPMYDLATLLHSLHVMSAILSAIEEGESDRLLLLSADGRVEQGVLLVAGNPLEESFLTWVERETDPKILGERWRARLHIGAANALFGWLKYARAVQTGHAWDAIFVSVLYQLEQGRRALEEERS